MKKLTWIQLRDFVTNRWFVRTVCFGIFVWSCGQLLRFEAALRAGTPAPTRPEIVAGILPVGHFMSFFVWLRGGGWDTILPAGLVVIIAALATSLLFKRGFCAWICPLGTLWEYCALAGRVVMRRQQNIALPRVLDWIGRGLQLLLSLFIMVWLASVGMDEAASFRQLPYMWIADLKTLHGFTQPVYLVVIVVAVVLFFFFGSLWCRYLCPVGGLYSVVGMASPCKVYRDPETCIDCKKCARVCHNFVDPTQQVPINSNVCDGCMDCVKVCPVDDCLQPWAFARWRMKPWMWAVGVVTVWFGIVLGAQALGRWHTTIPNEVFGQVIQSGLLEEQTPLVPE
ncbi:MAG: 4Fe-4S binding protein [Actinomycetes bacterium]|nr:4Fe-4S binding protein [Actinomycetes bacterium]